MARKSKHVIVWTEANPSAPWSCYFCSEPILHRKLVATGLVVHHLDENRSNNDLSNLVGAHRSCHTGYHKAGSVTPPHVRAKQSAALLGRKKSAATRKRMSKAAKLREAKNSGVSCSYCDLVSTKSHITRHQRIQHQGEL